MIRKNKEPFFLISLLTISGSVFGVAESILPKIPMLLSEPQFEMTIPLDEDSRVTHVKMIRYNEEIYELAFRVYSQNNNLLNAYSVAFSAVKQNPKAKVWHARLAEIAIWYREPSVALNEYLILSEEYNDKAATKSGIELSKKMHEDPALVRFLMQEFRNGNHTDVVWEDYINAMLRLGNIEALKAKIFADEKDISEPLYYRTLSRIYSLCDEPKSQLDILNKMVKRASLTPEVANQIASIYSSEGRVSEAFDVLNEARKMPGKKDFVFWRSYALLASLLDKTSDEFFANKRMLDFKDSDSSVYLRQIEIFQQESPKRALQFALIGRKRYPHDYYLLSRTLALLVDQKEGKLFPIVMKNIPKDLYLKMRKNENYWRAKAMYFQQMGNDGEAYLTWLDAIDIFKENDALLADFLYYLLDTNKWKLAQKYALLWEDMETDNQSFKSALAQIHARTGNRLKTRAAVNYFYDRFDSESSDPYWLILFKDTLENSFFDRAAQNVNYLAWPIYLYYLRTEGDLFDETQIMDYVKLSILNAAGDPTAIALYQLQDHETEDVELLLLTWAIGHNFNQLAKAIYWRYYFKGMEPPLWTSLSIAVATNDKRWMRNILIDKRNISSYRDRINAAMKTDIIPRGQTDAFNELKKHPKDQQLYDQYFTPIMLRTSRQLQAYQDYYQYGNLIGPRTGLSYKWFLMPSLSLKPYDSVWVTHNMPGGDFTAIGLPFAGNQPIVNVPGIDERAGVVFDWIRNRGDWLVDLAYRKNLTSFMNAKATRNLILLSDWDMSFTLGVNQESDDTASMLIGGMKDMAEVALHYRPFAGERITGIFQQNQFYTQDRQYLAHGYQYYLSFEHKLWQSTPDWTLRPYGYVTQYYDRTHAPIEGRALQLIPEGVTPDVNFFIPISFNEYGLTFTFNQNYVEDYTHRWHPFSEFTISRNSAVGTGELFNVGLAGMVFGRDHLLIYYQWGNNQAQGIQTSQLIRLSYRMYS